MKIVNLKCDNTESFKYSVLISLHYYDLIPHPERISRLKNTKMNIFLLIIHLMNLK